MVGRLLASPRVNIQYCTLNERGNMAELASSALGQAYKTLSPAFSMGPRVS